MPKTIEKPQVQPKIEMDKRTKKQLKADVQEESQVIVHGAVKGSGPGERIRIWKSMCLIPKESKKESKLIHVENVSMYPEWTNIPFGKTFYFTLVFGGLPKNCKIFDLLERIPEPGEMNVLNIKRNTSDIYSIEF